MIVCIIVCILFAFILFFPFTFWIDGEGDKTGVGACVKIFKKQIFEFRKSFDDDDDEKKSPKKNTEKKEEQPKKTEVIKAELSKEIVEKKTSEKVDAPEEPAEKSAAPAEDYFLDDSCRSVQEENSKPEKTEMVPFENSEEVPSEKSEKEKPEKRKLTPKETWTILLTPEFDSQAWWATKGLLSRGLKLVNLKFYNCFVEGFRVEYPRMGQLAALNAIFQSYPYIGAWDFRMDWTGTAEVRGEGHVRARVNIARLVGLLVAVLFYGGVTAFRFWRRRALVLKTGELPELGFIRNKIVNMMAEED